MRSLNINDLKCGTAIITPFFENGDIDLKTYEKIVEHQIQSGINFIVATATTGEGAVMTIEEQITVIERTVEICKDRVPVVAGYSSNNTAVLVENAKKIVNTGADVLLVASPAYNKPTGNGLLAHYRVLAAAVDIPIILYNVPGRTASCIPADVVIELSKIKNIIGIKEASGNLEYMMNIRKNTADDFLILSGDDTLTLPMIACGGNGVISVCSNEFPAEMTQLVEHALNNEFEDARKIQFKYLELMKGNFIETNPIPVKTAMGKIHGFTPFFRLPLVQMSIENEQTFLDIVRGTGLIDN